MKNIFKVFIEIILSNKTKNEKILLSMCFGDKKTFESLIIYEQRRDKKISRATAIKNAIERMKRDNNIFR